MGLLSAAMAAELAKPNQSLRRLLTITFPDGDHRYSDVAVCSASLGYFEPRIKRWGTIPKSLGDARNALIVPEWRVEILDHDKDWSRRAASYEIKGSPATLLYASPWVAPASWLTRFSGILSNWDFADQPVISARFQPNQLGLNSAFPTLRLTTQDFSGLPKESENHYVPLCYGRHDSFGLGDVDGQIKPIYVGEYTGAATGSRYVICFGRIKRILHAYSNGARLQETTWDADPTFVTASGRTYSVINFETDRSAQEITLDVEGYEDVGDGSGTLIADPCDQLEHLLINFVFGRWESGAWLTSSPYVGSFSTARTFLGGRLPAGYRGGRYLNGGESNFVGADVVNEFCESMGVHAYWSSAGQIVLTADLTTDPGYPIGTQWFRRPFDEFGELRPSVSATDTVNRLVIEGGLSDALGGYQERLEVLSQETSTAATDTLSAPWAPGYV